jgi:two-component system phosphate regulon response regulator PhoB
MAGEPLVLVVEDEPAQREVLAYNIRAEGYEVVTAETGTKPSSSCARRRPT